jgi:hypothetical protein
MLRRLSVWSGGGVWRLHPGKVLRRLRPKFAGRRTTAAAGYPTDEPWRRVVCGWLIQSPAEAVVCQALPQPRTGKPVALISLD